MLTDTELESYFEKHGVSPQARDYIRKTRENPSRLVGTEAQGNVVSGFPSAKGGTSIQTESRTAEHWRALEHEHSRSVVEYWDQSPEVAVTRTSKKGKPLHGGYTPDFVVLDLTGPYVEEVKTADEISKLLRTKPADWIETDSGVTFRPALEAYRQIGLAYVVTCAPKANAIRTDNLKLLLRARNSTDSTNDDIRSAVERALSEQAWLRLKALGSKVGMENLTPLLQLIDQSFLHASLSDELLAQPDAAWVARSPEILALRKGCNAEPFAFLVPNNESVQVSASHVPSGRKAARAIANLARLAAGEKSRSVRRWKKKAREEADGGKPPNEFQAVAPNWEQCGNRTKRLVKEQLDFLKKFISEHHATILRLGICASHRLYKNLAEVAHPLIPPVTRPTLEKYILLEDPKEIARGRGGRRAANAAAEPSPVETRQILATRPFQLAVIDHYEADIFCVLASRDGKKYTAKPWLTVLVDVATGYVYSFWLSFRAPSRRACAMVLRLCVRKHGRLPEEILFDRGPEFESVYFYALLGHCGVGRVLRPKEHPRFGAQGERFFGEFKALWLAFRAGNIVSRDEARAVSRTHTAEISASLSIDQLLAELLAFCDWRNANKVDLSNLSPIERVTEGLQTFSCSGVVVADDATFRIASAVDVRDYALDPVRGIHIGELHYWHPSLRKLAALGRVDYVRDEPEDPYRVYAKVANQWVTCLASGAQQLVTKDPVQRLAEAVRIHDGKTARLEAKDDADQLLITKMREFDAKWVADAAITKAAIVPTDTTQTGAESIFERIRRSSVDSLKTSKWE